MSCSELVVLLVYLVGWPHYTNCELLRAHGLV